MYPEFDIITNKFYVLNFDFNTLLELKQQYYQINRLGFNIPDIFLQNKNDDFVFDPYVLIEKLFFYKFNNKILINKALLD